MGFEELEGSGIHDRAEDFLACIREHHSSLLVGIGEITTFWNWDTLATVPLLMIHVTKDKVIHMLVDVF